MSGFDKIEGRAHRVVRSELAVENPRAPDPPPEGRLRTDCQHPLATGWQPHTVGGALAGALQRRLGYLPAGWSRVAAAIGGAGRCASPKISSRSSVEATPIWSKFAASQVSAQPRPCSKSSVR